MMTEAQAAAAGAKDGREGLGPLPPKKGAPGSHATKLHDAYMHGYRDANIATFGVRGRQGNPRSRSGAVSQFVLYARKKGGPLLKFVGNSKFARRGRAVIFRTQADANLAAWVLRDTFPEALNGYELFATAK